MILSYNEHPVYRVNIFGLLIHLCDFKFIQVIKNIVIDVKQLGLKKSIKKHGIKMLVIVFFYYLTRDTFLYIILPYLILK